MQRFFHLEGVDAEMAEPADFKRPVQQDPADIEFSVDAVQHDFSLPDRIFAIVKTLPVFVQRTPVRPAASLENGTNNAIRYRMVGADQPG